MSVQKHYSTLQKELLHDNGYWLYMHDQYVLSDGRSTGDYFYADSHGSTIIIPILPDGRLIMVEQFRYLNQRLSIEFPGGGIPKGYTPEENALKELREETGMDADTLVHVGAFNPCNGITNEWCSVYIAKNLRLVGQNTDATEAIRIIHVSVDECQEMIRCGEIWDGMTITSWMLFQSKQSKDFSP
ncbi:MAG: NUDIX domain-containing protein [bacterium]